MIPEEKIVNLLLELGIRPVLVGFREIVFALELVLKDWNALDRITKEIYPGVAKRMGKTASQVERGIRTAVTSMFDHQDCERIVQILGMVPNMYKGKYTNTEFLALCAMKLRGMQL